VAASLVERVVEFKTLDGDVAKVVPRGDGHARTLLEMRILKRLDDRWHFILPWFYALQDDRYVLVTRVIGHELPLFIRRDLAHGGQFRSGRWSAGRLDGGDRAQPRHRRAR